VLEAKREYEKEPTSGSCFKLGSSGKVA
jgi:hypothetical protein